MKRNLSLLTLLAAIALMATAASAQGFGPGPGDGICNFIDEDGDGYNDLAPDADGDGIPNGVDPDYVSPMDGTGNRFGANRNIDTLSKILGVGNMGGAGRYGVGDGTGDGTGPVDGTGFGPGTGDCINDKTVVPGNRLGLRR
ncbi:hypothetical protein KKG45_14375 [bacterium]|nr:hypothetical protein [bacterium]MBU1074424.1 hypothetical protein [bacterium]MBU1674914.1 hypothetical protein [bacterium]